MYSLFNVIFKELGGLRCVMTILGVRKVLHLVPDVPRRPETAQVPPRIDDGGKLPAVVPKVIRSHSLDELVVCNHRTEPRLAHEKMIERIFKHPHMHRIHGVWEMNNFRHVRNLIHVANHNDRPVSARRRRSIETAQDTLALILFSAPRILVLRGLFGGHDDVLNLVEPLCEPVSIILKKELFGSSDVTHFRFDKYETINILVETHKSELENVELVIKHETIYEHLYE
jgi:hypothetical protein